MDLGALDNTRKRPEHILQTPLRGISILNVVNAPCAYFQQLFQQSQLINQITGETRFSPSIVVTATTFKAHSGKYVLTPLFRHPITDLVPLLPHTIGNVRLAVAKTLHTFMSVASLPRGWMGVPFLHLLFQNLLVGERCDIHEATLTIWKDALSTMSPTEGTCMEATVTQAAAGPAGVVCGADDTPRAPSGLFHVLRCDHRRREWWSI